jgi:hypothetical protein
MRFLLPLCLLIASLAGCSTCHYRAQDIALSSDRCPEAPACQRMRVHAILVKGFDPLDCAGVNRLSDALIESGFAKVYRIENHHAGLIGQEIERIVCEQPEARFVVVGSGSGAVLARHIVGRLSAAGHSVDALVEIAPVHPGYLGHYSVPDSVRHRVIGRLGTFWAPAGCRTEYRMISSLGHWSTCSNSLVVDLVREELVMSAQNVEMPDDSSTVTLPIHDQPAPRPGTLPPESSALSLE